MLPSSLNIASSSSASSGLGDFVTGATVIPSKTNWAIVAGIVAAAVVLVALIFRRK